MVIRGNIGSFSTIAAGLRPAASSSTSLPSWLLGSAGLQPDPTGPPGFLPTSQQQPSASSLLLGGGGGGSSAPLQAAAAVAAPARPGPFGLPLPLVIGGVGALGLAAFLLLRKGRS